MDNLTHSLTGALAAKIIDHTQKSPGDSAQYKQKAFWLILLCANLPDIDVVAGFFGDRIFSMQHHRGITHSILFAPVFAALPAAAFYFLFKLKNFKALWISSLVGIFIHIFFDVITTFGTQLFAPFSTTRYALDWMFIVDPFFTGILALALFAQKITAQRKKLFVFAGSTLVLLYLSVEMINHHLAYSRVHEAMAQQGNTEARISALPQPLSIFRWKGLAQTDERVLQTFFSVSGETDSLAFENHNNAQDEFVQKAMHTRAGKWYMTFSRHPWIQSTQNGNLYVVEFRDLQFTVDKKILNALGFPERSMPFFLRFVYSSSGDLMEIIFDGKNLTSKE